jgi:hypothetical protein
MQIASSNRWGRPASGQASIEATLPGSYQVTLGGLGKAAATQHWQVGRNRHAGIESAAADPNLSEHADDTRAA